MKQLGIACARHRCWILSNNVRYLIKTEYSASAHTNTHTQQLLAFSSQSIYLSSHRPPAPPATTSHHHPSTSNRIRERTSKYHFHTQTRHQKTAKEDSALRSRRLPWGRRMPNCIVRSLSSPTQAASSPVRSAESVCFQFRIFQSSHVRSHWGRARTMQQ